MKTNTHIPFFVENISRILTLRLIQERKVKNIGLWI